MKRRPTQLRRRNEECLRKYGKSVAEVDKEMKQRSKKNYIVDMKRRNARKQKQSDLDVRHYTDKWVPEYLNDEWEQLKNEFIEWYCY